ncbi:MAG TPA: pitrilysin family protein [Chloroflexota bacterium]|nr:pitrilysin family protein [Chloroflexota bacterium]
MQPERFSLDNGLRVVYAPMPSMHSVSVAVFVGFGSRYETDREAGAAHLIEHMLFKGTARRPRAQEISQPIDAVGGVLNASTDKETTAYWVKVAQDSLPLAIDLLADMLMNSRLMPSDLVREKGVVFEELRMLRDDPQDWLNVLTDEILWPGHPLGREIAGTEESLRGLTRAALRRLVNRFYGPNNAVLSVAGGIHLEAVRPLIETHFGGWRSVPPVSPPMPAREPPFPTDRVEPRPIEQVHVALAYPAVSRRHPDAWPLDLLCTILGGGNSSRLFIRLREQLGLAYDIGAGTVQFSDSGAVSIYVGVDPANAERVIATVFQEVDRFLRRRVPTGELDRAKRYLRGRLFLSLEDTHAVASWYGAQELLRGEIKTPEEVAAEIDSVTAEDIRRVARSYLSPDNARVITVGPAADLDVARISIGA